MSGHVSQNTHKKSDDLNALTKQSEAQYVIDSSLMQSGDNFRLTVSLMNTTTMVSIWCKTYDKKMSASDIFATQDEIVKNLVQELSAGGFINAAMMKDTDNRSVAKGIDNISAYDCVNFFKAAYISSYSQEVGIKALKCLKESTKTDPKYADAWSSLGYLQASMYSWGQLEAAVLDESLSNVERAIALEPNNAVHYFAKAFTLNMQKNGSLRTQLLIKLLKYRQTAQKLWQTLRLYIY